MMKSLLPRSMTLAALALLCSQAQAETLQTGKDVEAPTAKWEGVALGFEPPQPGLLGDMLGIRPILRITASTITSATSASCRITPAAVTTTTNRRRTSTSSR